MTETSEEPPNVGKLIVLILNENHVSNLKLIIKYYYYKILPRYITKSYGMKLRCRKEPGELPLT